MPVYALEGCPCSGKSTVLARISELRPDIVTIPEPVAEWAETLRNIDSGVNEARLTLQSQVVQHYADVAQRIRLLDPGTIVVLERSPRSMTVFKLLHKQYDPSRAAAYDFVASGCPDFKIDGYFELVVDPAAAAVMATTRKQCGDTAWTVDALRTYGAVFEAVFDGIPRTPLRPNSALAETIIAAITA